MVSTCINNIVVVTILVVNISCNINNVLAVSNAGSGLATWYGPETGAGKGAACGWEDDVKDPPFKSMIAAGNSNIFLNGKGCGHCFQIFCSRKPLCSEKPINVTISDKCPGACDNIPFHFDLSGLAFGAMAVPGQEHNLRMLGQVDIQYKRIPCNYGATKIAFKVSPKINPYWFAAAIEYTNGDGGFSRVEISPSGVQTFSAMENIWGAVWKKDINQTFKAPFSFKLTSADGKTLVANNAVPQNYAAGQKYSSNTIISTVLIIWYIGAFIIVFIIDKLDFHNKLIQTTSLGTNKILASEANSQSQLNISVKQQGRQPMAYGHNGPIFRM